MLLARLCGSAASASVRPRGVPRAAPGSTSIASTVVPRVASTWAPSVGTPGVGTKSALASRPLARVLRAMSDDYGELALIVDEGAAISIDVSDQTFFEARDFDLGGGVARLRAVAR